MWKAAFTGRSERGERNSGKERDRSDAASVSTSSGHRRRHRSGSDAQSTVSSASRKTDGERKRRSNSRAVSYGYEDIKAGSGSRGGSLTEGAIQALQEDDWVDDDDRRRGGRGESESRDSRRRRDAVKAEQDKVRTQDPAQTRDYDTERARKVSHNSSSAPSGRSRGMSMTDGSRDALGARRGSRGLEDGSVGSASHQDHTMSGAMPYDPHVQSQFPGQNPSTFEPSAFSPNPHGEAADYYGDQGESVGWQPGIRPLTPMMLVNPDVHLITPSSIAQPAQDTGHGSAADFYGGDNSAVSMAEVPGKQGKLSRPGLSMTASSPDRLPGKQNKMSTSGIAAATAATAVVGGMAASSLSHSGFDRPSVAPSQQAYSSIPGEPQSTSASQKPRPTGPSRPSRHNSEPSAVPGGGYYAMPPAVTGKLTGNPPFPYNDNAGLHTAAGAAAGAAIAGYAAYEMSQHHHAESTSQYGPSTSSHPQIYSSSLQDHALGSLPMNVQHGRHEHRGPISRLKDGFLNIISDPDDVRRMEEYTEYIGVCKHCFDPRSTPWEGPRQHHYHPRKRDSFETLRQRRSMERLRKKSSGESLKRAGSSRVEKESRYYASDATKRRRGSSKNEILGAGILGVGAAAAAGAMLHDSKDFDDTYSVKSGHRAGSAIRRRSTSSSRERKQRMSHGTIGHAEGAQHVTVRTRDGRIEKRRVAHRSRSRSRSSTRKSGWVGDAAIGALGAGTLAGAASSHDHRRVRGDSENVTVRHHGHRTRSRSSSGSADLSGSTYRRNRHRSPTSRYHDTPHQHFTASQGKTSSGRTKPKKKKQRGFFTFSNSSSGSSESGMAFGEDSIGGRSQIRRVPSVKRKASRRTSNERMTAAVLGIGATAAALAAAQKGHKLRNRDSRTSLGAHNTAHYSNGGRQHDSPMSADEEGWEDEQPSDEEFVSSDDSGLAFGDDHERRRLSRQSRESLTSNSSAGGLSVWGWRWGNKKKRRGPSSSQRPADFSHHDQVVTGPATAGLGAGIEGDYHDYEEHESVAVSGANSSFGPMQRVDPRPLSETSMAVEPRYASMPGAFDPEGASSRPGPAPLQQPQPIAPIQPAFTRTSEEDAFHPAPRSDRPSGSSRTQSAPARNESSSLIQDAAIIGGAALLTGSIIASQGRRTKESSNVRFGLTEEQQQKEDRERRLEGELEERRRVERTKALKEEAERHARAEDAKMATEERERLFRENEAREEDRRRAARKEAEEQALLDRQRQLESRQREEAYHREQLRIAEDERRSAERKAAEQAETERLRRERREREETYAREQPRVEYEGYGRHESQRRVSDVVTPEAPSKDDLERSRLQMELDVQNERRQRELHQYRLSQQKETDDVAERLRNSANREGESSDHGSAQRSARAWEAPAAAGVAGALVGAILAGAMHGGDDSIRGSDERHEPHREDYTHNESSHQDDHGIPPIIEPYTAKQIVPDNERSGVPITDDDLYDPDYFKRKRTTSDLTRREDLARKAAERVVSEREQYYNAPAQSQADFFAPKELLERDPEGKERVADPIGDNNVDSFHVSHDDVREHFENPIYDRNYRSEAFGKRGIPRLNVIAPTPPLSSIPSSKAEASPSHSALAKAEEPEEMPAETERRRQSINRAVSWGEDSTHIYQVQTPESAIGREEDSRMNDIPASAQTPLDEIVVETTGPDGEPRTTRYNADNHTGPHVEQGMPEPEETRESYQRPFFGTGPGIGAFSIDSPGTEGAPPVRGWVEGETNDPTPAEESAPKMPGAFDDDEFQAAVSNNNPTKTSAEPANKDPFNMAYEKPLSKKDKKKRDKAGKRTSIAGDESPTPTSFDLETAPEPAQEPLEQPDDYFMSKKDKKKRDKTAKRAVDTESEPLDAAPVRSIDDTTTPDAERVEEPAWEPSLSKKEKKKKEKAAKRAFGFDDEPSPGTPISEPLEPVLDFEQKEEAAPEVQSAWEPPLSKKEQKKRDKAAKRAFGLDDDSNPGTPISEHLEPVLDLEQREEAAPEVQSAWEPPLSKKEQKKREKAAKRAFGFDDDSNPGTPISEHLEPVLDLEQEEEAAPEVQSAWEPPLSKKEQKKRDKAAKRAFGLDDESNHGTPTYEPSEPVQEHDQTAEAAQEIAPEWEPPLSKKELKKREKAVKRGNALDSDSGPSTPAVERSESMAGYPEADDTMPETEPAWEPPLSKKEQKKREKEQKRNGFANAAASLMTTGGVAAAVDAAVEAEEDEWSAPSGKKDKKSKKKSSGSIERDIGDFEPALESTGLPPAPSEDRYSSQRGRRDASESPDANVTSESEKDRPRGDTTIAIDADASDEFGGFASKKSKKKKKRESARFNEPAASSPLRSEVAFDDYVGTSQKAHQSAPGGDQYSYTANDPLKDVEEPKAEAAFVSSSWADEMEEEEQARREQNSDAANDRRRAIGSPREMSPTDDSRSLASANTDTAGGRRASRSSKSQRRSDQFEAEPYHYEDRSVADPERAESYESRKASKRRSRQLEDDTSSVTSSKSRREKDEPASTKKEKKGGFFGLFSRKTSDGDATTKSDTRNNKDDDVEDGERKHRRRRSHRDSEFGDDDDSRSFVSASDHRQDGARDDEEDDDRERDRRRHRDDQDQDHISGDDVQETANRSNDGKSERRKHHRKHRSDSLYGADSYDSGSKDQSFLGMRVEDLPPLPDSRPASPASASIDQEEQDLGNPVSAELSDLRPAVTANRTTIEPHTTSDESSPVTTHADSRERTWEEEVQYLPALPESRPESPLPAEVQEVARPAPPYRPSSSTAVPLRFRPPPFSPSSTKEHPVSYGSPSEQVPESPASGTRSKARPKSSEYKSGEFRPLYLVERNTKLNEVEEVLPSLPSSIFCMML